MNYKKLLSSLVFSFIFAISFLGMAGEARADTWTTTGWGWSSTLGHVSFNCDTAAICPQSDYKVTVDTYTGLMSGYAWSSNVGWIKFAGDGGLHEAPRVVDWSTNRVVGWVRACVGTVNGDCTGADRTDGWDGWIKLSDDSLFISPKMDGKGGITYNNTTGYFVGYSWGNTNMGWLTFSNVRFINNSSSLPLVTLTASPTSIDSGGNTTLTWTPTNANSCIASNTNDATQNTGGIFWSGSKLNTDGAKTEQRTNLTGTFPKTYSITCTNAFGTATATAIVRQNSTPTISPTTSGGGGTPTLTLTPSCDPTKITLNWPAVSGATGYVITRSTTLGGNYSSLGTVDAGATSYVDLGVTPSILYYYRIDAIGVTKRHSGSTRASACNNISSNTGLKMWISEDIDGKQDTELTYIKTIKAGENFTIEWDEVNTPNVINFGDCDLRKKYNNGEFEIVPLEGIKTSYIYENAPAGRYVYTISCNDKQPSPISYTGKVYKQDGNVFRNASNMEITELTVIVKNSKINEQ